MFRKKNKDKSKTKIKGASSSKDIASTTAKKNPDDVAEKIDLSKIHTFEDWLIADPRYGEDSFQKKKYIESGKQKLSLEGQAKSSQDLEILPKLIKDDTDLTWLSLGDSKIGPEGCIMILDHLMENKTLGYISLSFNEIDAEVCPAISKLLLTNNTLTSIDLKNNDIGDKGFAIIMEALKSNDTITELDLRRNGITPDGCESMKDMLQINKRLQKIELRGNSIGNSGCEKITEGIRKNTSLCKITLERNHIDSNTLRACMVYTDRNEVITRHRDSVTSDGISFYVSIEGVEDDNPHLAWAMSKLEPITTVQEAANSVESLALLVVVETLRSIINPEDGAAEDENQIVEMIRDKKQLRKLLNQKINDETYILHTLAASTHPHTIGMMKFLVDICGASFYTVEDHKGSNARSIALASADEAKHKWAKTHGSLLGRYIIQGGKGIHSSPVNKSPTSIIHFATDVTKPQEDPTHHVVVKIVYDEETFKREQTVRLVDNLRKSTIESLSAISSGDDIPESLKRYDSSAIVPLYRFHDEVDELGVRCQCLVLEKMGKNLHNIIESEAIAGRDEAAIVWYGSRLAKAIQHVHSRGYIHADIKLKNVIRGENKEIKLIDLDATVPIGEKLTEGCSTAYISPEVARAVLTTGETDVKSIQQEITQHQKTMYNLNLSKDDDIAIYNVATKKVKTLLAAKSVLENPRSSLYADKSVDIWSFGVIMYYLSIGKPLFLYNLASNLANAAEKSRLMSWRGLNAGDLKKVKVTPESLSESFREKSDNFLMKCLHVDPAKRFLSMEEVLEHELFT